MRTIVRRLTMPLGMGVLILGSLGWCGTGLAPVQAANSVKKLEKKVEKKFKQTMKQSKKILIKTGKVVLVGTAMVGVVVLESCLNSDEPSEIEFIPPPAWPNDHCPCLGRPKPPPHLAPAQSPAPAPPKPRPKPGKPRR